MADETTLDSLQRENEELRRRLASVEAREARLGELQALETQVKLLRDRQTLLENIIDNAPPILYAKDLQLRHVLANATFGRLLGCSRSEIEGKTDYDLFSKEVADVFREQDQRVLSTRSLLSLEVPTPMNGELRVWFTLKFPLVDATGALCGIGGVSTDITNLKRAEDERASLQTQIIESQQLALLELSTPLLPIAEHVVVMPLIGSVDNRRAQQVVETLTHGVVAHSAATAILDITGVRSVNGDVVDALIRAAKAARLLGAEVVLTGISPPLARQLVELELDLTGIATRGTLQAGISKALSHERRPAIAPGG